MKKLTKPIKRDAPASDNAGFDVHATDPMRLKKEVKKDLGAVAPVEPLPEKLK